MMYERLIIARDITMVGCIVSAIILIIYEYFQYRYKGEVIIAVLDIPFQ